MTNVGRPVISAWDNERGDGIVPTQVCFAAQAAVLVRLGVISAVLILSGCAPSIRYARDNAGQKGRKDSHIVSADWDYRRYYKVPAARLKKIIDSYLGAPYRYGGTTRRGVDCSGLVQLVFKELNHAKLPRTTRKLKRLGKAIIKSRARAGDLVFFRGGLFNTINHVGIYVGNGSFAHASAKKGVIYSSLDGEYYRKRFAGIRRVF